MAKTNKPGLLLNGRAQLEFLVRVLNPSLFVMLLGGILLPAKGQTQRCDRAHGEEEKEEKCFRGAVGLRLWPGGFVAQSHHADRSLRRYFPSLAYLAFGNDRRYRLWRMGHLHLS